VEASGLAAAAEPVRGAGQDSRRAIEAHLRVVSELAASTTVLPMRYGMVVAGRRALSAELTSRRLRYKSMLGRLKDKTELSVKAAYDEEAVLADVVRSDRAVRRLAERTRGATGWAMYDERVRLGELVSRALEERRARDGAALLDRVRPVCEGVRIGPAGGHSVADVACLVERSRIDDLSSAVGEWERAGQGRFRVRYTGPLPPFSFVDGAGGAVRC
jgi:hypothetical protein